MTMFRRRGNSVAPEPLRARPLARSQGGDHATECRQCARPFRAVPRAGISGHARPQEGGIRRPCRRRAGRRGPRMGQDRGIQGTELRPRGADRQSGQGLPAARRGVRRGRFREDDPLRPRVAGLRRLLPLALLAALQGADVLRVLVDDRGCGGVRRPQQHDRRAGQHLCDVQAEDDRGVDHLHGGSHRRRPQRLHQDRQGKGQRSGRISTFPSRTRPPSSAAISPATTMR